MRRKSVVTAMMILVASLVSALTIPPDPALGKARLLFLKCAAGEREAGLCVEELKPIAENREASSMSRAFAMQAIVWLDVQTSELDLRPYFVGAMNDERGPDGTAASAQRGRWIVEVFGQSRTRDQQERLLRSLVTGRHGGEKVGLARRWAATELCARGVMDEAVRVALEEGFRDGSKAINDCEAKVAFLRSRGEAPIGPALQIRDQSFSQEFRRFVLAKAFASKNAQDESLIAKNVRRYWQWPAELVVAQEAMSKLLAHGWSVNRIAENSYERELFNKFQHP